jgi:hypothetical protein
MRLICDSCAVGPGPRRCALRFVWVWACVHVAGVAHPASHQMGLGRRAPSRLGMARVYLAGTVSRLGLSFSRVES